MTTGTQRSRTEQSDSLRVAGMNRSRWSVIRPYLIVFLLFVLVTPAILWMLKTSLTLEQSTTAYPPQLIPDPITSDNYSRLLSGNAPRFFLNSIVIALGSIALSLLVGLPAAYAAVRFEFRGKEALFLSILVASYIPAITVLVAIYALAIRTGLVDTYPLLIVVYSGVISGRVVWFLRSFIENVPVDLEEAALVDGATRQQILSRITIPLIAPGLASVAVFVYVFVWNDFLIGAFLTQAESMRTVQVGLVRFQGTGFGVIWGQFMAYAMLGLVPVLVLFLGVQRWFVQGLTAGATKG